jgi:hypothetical protein
MLRPSPPLARRILALLSAVVAVVVIALAIGFAEGSLRLSGTLLAMTV